MPYKKEISITLPFDDLRVRDDNVLLSSSVFFPCLKSSSSFFFFHNATRFLSGRNCCPFLLWREKNLFWDFSSILPQTYGRVLVSVSLHLFTTLLTSGNSFHLHSLFLSSVSTRLILSRCRLSILIHPLSVGSLEETTLFSLLGLYHLSMCVLFQCTSLSPFPVGRKTALTLEFSLSK